jgi:hypothetical protein
MRYKFLLLILLAILIVSAATVLATDLRGRVDGFNPNTQMNGPLPGVGVALFATQPNGTFAIVRKAVTDPDGIYYFRGVYPGQYVLQIGGTNYPLEVGTTQMQDIPIIARAR